MAKAKTETSAIVLKHVKLEVSNSDTKQAVRDAIEWCLENDMHFGVLEATPCIVAVGCEYDPAKYVIGVKRDQVVAESNCYKFLSDELRRGHIPRNEQEAISIVTGMTLDRTKIAINKIIDVIGVKNAEFIVNKVARYYEKRATPTGDDASDALVIMNSFNWNNHSVEGGTIATWYDMVREACE